MTAEKRVFISFAIEDRIYRDGLVKQAKEDRSPFEFADMSVKEPWKNSWKSKCRTKIKGCDGVIALISKETKNADGARWEIICAEEEGIPVRFFKIHKDELIVSFSEISKRRLYHWTWPNITGFISSL